ncbi:hypothetical protein PGTUg99_030730 [Puccinia graminis f. sp. tritici]|uniref:Uncharacterized protein n=1 Tax=Puccinia graminis f. sp. tritici TaxID=56615 RepID=A0A5B0P5F8_PUCGR|nr:hypothetical protein PGTUg99_030730 [Puccinia graminis f. sp. tritici]
MHNSQFMAAISRSDVIELFSPPWGVAKRTTVKVAKPMSLASSTGGPWLIYYGTIDLSSNQDVFEIKAKVSFWKPTCPTFMRPDACPQISGKVKFTSTAPQLQAFPLGPSPMADKDKTQNRSISCRSTFRPIEHSNAIIKPGQIYGTISTPSFITCNSDEPVDYRLLLNTNASAEHSLSPEFLYILSGKLLLLNTPAPPVLNYYLDLVAKICPENHQLEDEQVQTFTSGIGIVVLVEKPKTDPDSDVVNAKKTDLIIHVNHSDWDPATFDVKYIVPANPKLINTHTMLRVGREFFFDGFIFGWDLKERMAIIKVLSFSPLPLGNGGSAIRTPTSTPQASPVKKGRKFVTFGEDNTPAPAPLGTVHPLGPSDSTSELLDLGEGSSRDPAIPVASQSPDEIPLSLMPTAKGKAKATEGSIGNKKRRTAPGV